MNEYTHGNGAFGRYFLLVSDNEKQKSLFTVFIVYHTGGIVTITHKALYEDPIGVGKLLERLSKHPLWDCFILSSVLSVYIRSVGGKDPLAAFRE